MQFLELPRELRDMIYTEMLMSTKPLPSGQDTQTAANWHLVRQTHQPSTDSSRCFVSSRAMPGTCASVLASNRQVHQEMMQIANKARQAGQLASRLDCLVLNNAHYFTWLAVPFVRPADGSARRLEEERGQSWTSKIMESWSWVVSFFNAWMESDVKGRSSSSSNTRLFSYTRSYANIERVWVDVRPVESTMSNGSGSAAATQGEMTSWAICAALKHMFDNGPDMMRSNRRIDCVDEVILNVVPRARTASGSPWGDESDEDALVIGDASSTSSPDKAETERLRNELVDVWDKIWGATDGRDMRARLYRTLLERIKRVRICVDGVTFRTRGLAVELERGRAEMRRIQMR
ncbi:hypothetical protein COCC4DRAFT_145628 [Bipolaris maydis ATCC 48331]|uniref:F-box domain-containing protein n=3 Tax=Cochliobolus heterostrophus TaxID=5016 RepID=M2UJI3_COCH5|nr:uncharacterized protein COCC4DRAFT_145628 [Bipolaris maydis ATCC 48331]EMD88107.1 hypothetical protein COCHEDRAFT_1183441 [Bipolaris maydis C5]ENI02309.1 hypothetical protein COCC4DRAFT_145628 [Bipolaris maydis ATCC 48331]KAJ6207078.1 hypothetical protein PSV09DRAFT_1183441 [Bipolaris maydis]